jgi:S1-C subfamily serine protease
VDSFPPPGDHGPVETIPQGPPSSAAPHGPPTDPVPRPPTSFTPRPPDPPTPEPPAGSRPRGWRTPLAILLGALLLVGGFGAGWFVRQGDDDGSSAQPAASSSPAASVEPDTNDRPTDPPLSSSGDEPVAAVADAVAPAVVQIETAQGLGSGVIYDPDGLVMTAAHVVEGSTAVTVRLADGSAVDGTVVGTNQVSDIGVVHITNPPDDLAVAVLAQDAPQVGDLAVAVGSPFALDQTVTAGVVSALDRAAPAGGPAVGTIQTDAPINPGNSGGPLANREGEVIGINSFIQTQNGGNIGLGFAVPIDIGERVADALVAGESVEFGFLGIEGGDAATGQAGALIAGVTSASPAADAGLRPGDLVVAIDGDAVTSFGDLGVIIRRHDPGDEVTLTVRRGNAEREVQVTLGATEG